MAIGPLERYFAASSSVRTSLFPMCSIHDGSFTSRSTNGASLSSKRRSARRSVSTIVTSLRSARNLGFDQPGEQYERFLPAEVTRFRRNGGGHAFLHHGELGSAK